LRVNSSSESHELKRSLYGRKQLPNLFPAFERQAGVYQFQVIDEHKLLPRHFTRCDLPCVSLWSSFLFSKWWSYR